MKSKIKEIIGILFFATVDIIIAYAITTPLGIKNTVVFQSLLNNYVITYEVIILFVLGLIEAVIYEKIAQKKSETV